MSLVQCHNPRTKLTYLIICHSYRTRLKSRFDVFCPKYFIRKNRLILDEECNPIAISSVFSETGNLIYSGIPFSFCHIYGDQITGYYICLASSLIPDTIVADNCSRISFHFISTVSSSVSS